MATIHCFGVGLVGSYVAKKMAEQGHHVHAYDPLPSRVQGIPGVFVHEMDKNDDPLNVMISQELFGDPSSLDSANSIVVSMLPGAVSYTHLTLRTKA